MAAAIKKGAALLAVPALIGVFSGTAAADPSQVTPADTAGYDDCPAGFVCYYTGEDGTGDMCAWQSADSNHATEPGGVCPWAADTPVRSVYNHGTSQEFIGVCSYEHANYDTVKLYVPQGLRGNTFDKYKVMSHKWVRSNGC